MSEESRLKARDGLLPEEEPRIIVAADDSKATQHALRVAARMGVLGRGRVELLAIVETSSYTQNGLWPPRGEALVETAHKMEARVLEPLRELLLAEGIEPNASFLDYGPTPETLAAVAARESAALVVCGRRELSSLSRWLKGSVSHKLCEIGETTVLVIPERATVPEPGTSRRAALLAFGDEDLDLMQGHARALVGGVDELIVAPLLTEEGRLFAGQRGQTWSSNPERFATAASTSAEVEAQLERRVAALERAGVKARGKTSRGRASRSIKALIREDGAGLLVVSGGEEEARFGELQAQVLRHATVPVLVTRPLPEARKGSASRRVPVAMRRRSTPQPSARSSARAEP